MPETAPDSIATPRFEWERIVRRTVMPGPQKLLAFVLASYADPDGSRVRPGIEVLAAVTGQSEKNVCRLMSRLRSTGLIGVTSRGGGRGGRGKATEYQLTIPTDLLDRFEVLGPADRPESEDIQVSSQNGSRPVDNPVDNHESQDIWMSSQCAEVIPIERTSGTPSDPIERTFSANERTSGCPTTNHITNHNRPTPVVTTQRKSRPRAKPTDREPPHGRPAGPREPSSRRSRRPNHAPRITHPLPPRSPTRILWPPERRTRGRPEPDALDPPQPHQEAS